MNSNNVYPQQMILRLGGERSSNSPPLRSYGGLITSDPAEALAKAGRSVYKIHDCCERREANNPAPPKRLRRASLCRPGETDTENSSAKGIGTAGINNGFTLIDLLLTLFIVSVLIMISTSNWSTFFQRHLSRTKTTEILHLLQFARLEAIHRHQIIGICGVNHLQQCTPDWSQGYMVFILPNSQQPALEILHLENNSQAIPIHSGKLPLVKFNKDGRCLSRGTLTIGPVNDQHKIVMYDSGRVRVAHMP